MSGVNRKIKRNKTRNESFNINDIKADVEKTKELVSNALEEATIIVNAGLAAIKDTDGPDNLAKLLNSKLDTLDSIGKAKDNIDIAIDKYLAGMEDGDDIDATIGVGENLGNYNMLHSQIVDINSDILKIAAGA